MNSCINGVPGSPKEFKEAEVINAWEICDVFSWEEMSFLGGVEFENLESDLWLELIY